MVLSFMQVLAIFGFLIVFCGMGLGTAIAWNQVRASIELNHTALWKELGSPSFSGYNPIARHRLGMFIMCGRFRNFGDPNFSRLGSRARAMTVAQIAIMIFVAIGMPLLSRLF
jgi:hypothetical protein